MNKPKPSAASARNPLYVKIGKRIRQARLMAQESNSRDLSLRLGWSAGRLHNYETGLSTPGVEETLQLCEALRIDPCWITYGAGAPRAAELHSARYRNFIAALDQAETDGNLESYLSAIRLSFERMQKFRRNPYSKIPDLMARRCEKFLGQRRGWIDEDRRNSALPSEPDSDTRQLLDLYSRLTPADRRRWCAMGRLLLD